MKIDQNMTRTLIKLNLYLGRDTVPCEYSYSLIEIKIFNSPDDTKNKFGRKLTSITVESSENPKFMHPSMDWLGKQLLELLSEESEQ